MNGYKGRGGRAADSLGVNCGCKLSVGFIIPVIVPPPVVPGYLTDVTVLIGNDCT